MEPLYKVGDKVEVIAREAGAHYCSPEENQGLPGGRHQGKGRELN